MKILFFSPHSYFNVHALPEKVVASSLKNNGNTIISVGCSGLYSNYCICMTAKKYSASTIYKNKICNECKFNRANLIKDNGFINLNIDDYLMNTDFDFIQNQLLQISPENYLDYVWKEIPVARYALYEFLLNRKLNSILLDSDEWNEFKIHFQNSLLTAIAGERIILKYNPDRLTTYNSNYSVNHIMCDIADKMNIPHFSLHAGGHLKNRLQEMTIFKGYLASYSWNSQNAWYEYFKYPISKKSIEYTNQHIKMLLDAKSPWVYSIKSNKKSEKELKEYFGIQPNQKVLVATMSSEDERFGAATVKTIPSFQNPIFLTNYEWINYLIDLVKNEPTLFLIIRVHPREFPNKREQVTSKQSIILESKFVNLPSNIKVNFPKDNISLHDIIKITDVCLNSTSTSGLEFLIFGIPVVIYDRKQLFSYGRELNLIADTIDEYKLKIFEATQSGKKLINIINAYRWLSYRNEVASINIKDSFQAFQYPKLIYKIFNIFNTIYLKSRFEFFIFNNFKSKKINIKLNVAIENNLQSHLDHFDIENYNKYSSHNEEVLIKKSVLDYINKISSPKKDPIFRREIYKLCQN